MHTDGRDDRSPLLPHRRARRGVLGIALGSLLGTSGLWRARAKKGKKKGKKKRCPPPAEPCPPPPETCPARTCCRCTTGPVGNCTILPGTGDPDQICSAFCGGEVLVALTETGQEGASMACESGGNAFCLRIRCPVV
jgi:hypothetical protein